MKKSKTNDRTALINTAVITALSACIMLGAVGSYRLTAGKGETVLSQREREAEVTDTAENAQSGKSEKAEKTEKSEEAEKSDKTEKSDKAEKSEEAKEAEKSSRNSPGSSQPGKL